MCIANLALSPPQAESRFLTLASRWVYSCVRRCGVTYLPGNYRLTHVQVTLDVSPPGVEVEVSRVDGMSARRYIPLPLGDFTSASSSNEFLVEASRRLEAVMLMAAQWKEFDVRSTPSPSDFEFNCDPDTHGELRQMMASVVAAEDEYRQAFMHRYWDKLRPEVRHV